MVDGGGNNAFLQSQGTAQRRNRTCRAHQVTYHRFGGRYGQVVGVITKHPLNRFGLGHVIKLGTGAMGINHVDVGGLKAGTLERPLHRPRCPVTLRVGSSDVESITS